MRVSPGWLEYMEKYPVRSNWMLKELERIKRHPVCVYQFPEAVCDYVSAGILHTARRHFKFLKAVCGTVGDTNHVWLIDTDAGIYLDFTVGQFPAIGLDIMAGSKETLESAGYNFMNEDDCDDVIKTAEEQYLNNLAKINNKTKKGGKRCRRRKTKQRAKF
jgi:hypothetical protein